MGRNKGASTLEGFMISTGAQGECFYTEKSSALVQAVASNYGRKASTEKVMAISMRDEIPEVKYITKVTLSS